MRIVKIVFSLILVCSMAMPVFGQKTLKNILENGELKVGMTGNQPPFCIKTNTGYIGYEADLAQALADMMGVELTIVELPFSELLPALEKGKVHAALSGMTITTERSVKAMFAGPYTLSGKSILTKSNVISRAENTDDVNKQKYKIAAMKGTNSTDFVKEYMPNAALVEVENYEAGIDMVLLDSVDAMVADYPVCIMAATRVRSRGYCHPKSAPFDRTYWNGVACR